MRKQPELTPEILKSPLAYQKFITSIYRPSDHETEVLFNSAKTLGASQLQLFNLAGACFAIQKKGHRRPIHIKNFQHVATMGPGGLNMPKKQEITIYRGLHAHVVNQATTPVHEVKNYIEDFRYGFESWTLNKEVAEFFAREEGIVLKATIMSDSDLILGFNVFGHLEEAEVIVAYGEMDFELEFIKRDSFSSNWGKCELWIRDFLNKVDLNHFAELIT